MSLQVASRPAPARGRPPSTTRDQVARVALGLFVRRGFEETTLDEVADAAGIGRRTLFRYFSSKNDLVWGNFDWVLDRLRAGLAGADPSEPLMETLAGAVIASNHYEGKALEELRLRMTLITSVPALQAHSMVRYADWRHVVAEFVSERIGLEADNLVPLEVAHMALAASMTAFVRWVAHPEEDLEAHLAAGYRRLAWAFADLA
ncbi:MAG: mycofactocin system transcriptional regulator [Solirubrobacteraceae bacterium]